MDETKTGNWHMTPVKIAIIGANGQLGLDLCKEAKEKKLKLFSFTHEDIQIEDESSFEKTISKVKPEIIVNCAAYHKVDEIEQNYKKAFNVNAYSNFYISRYAKLNNITYMFISTDYVFGCDTKRKTPYKEDDRPGPLNMYGISKLTGENIIRAYLEKYVIVRTSGLYGINGSNSKRGNFIELMIKLAREKKAINVVCDQVISPTYTANLAKQIIKIIQSKKYGTFHAVSTGECSWYDFACEIFKKIKAEVNIKPVDSNHFPTEAKRPNYSVLSCSKLKNLNMLVMNDWKTNLDTYLRDKNYI